MRLFLLGKDFHGQNPYLIKGKDAHYLADVLRLPEGQSIVSRDTQGRLWMLKLLRARKGLCTAEVSPLSKPEATLEALPEYQDLKSIILYQCLTKPRKLCQIVRQATEIGARKIILIKSRFSFPGSVKPERLEAQIKEAVQQSGSLVPTELEGPVEIDSIQRQSGSALFCHQADFPNQRSLEEVLQSLKPPVSVLVGPEGGLDDRECSLLKEKGFESVLFRTNILRAETAAVYALALVQNALQGFKAVKSPSEGNEC